MIQRIEQFDIKHGPGAVQIRGRLVFPSGAMRQNIEGGELREPPEDPSELFPILAVYNEEKRKLGYQHPQQTYQPTAAERVQEFHLRHGSDAILINGWWYYGDGAQRDGTPVNVLICCHFSVYGISPSSVCGTAGRFRKKERQGCCWENHLRRLSTKVQSV